MDVRATAAEIPENHKARMAKSGEFKDPLQGPIKIQEPRLGLNKDKRPQRSEGEEGACAKRERMSAQEQDRSNV